MSDLVVIELDRPRTLKYGKKALKMVEVITNTKITKFNPTDMSCDEVVKVLHAGLVHEDPTLTMVQLDDMIEDIPFGTIYQLVFKAIMAAFGVSEDKQDSPKQVPEV